MTGSDLPHRIRAGDVEITPIRYRAGLRLQRHAHPRPMFCYAFRGGYREYAARRVLDAGQGSVVYLPQGEPHWDAVAGDGLCGVRVEAGDGWMAALPRLLSVGPALVVGRAEWYAQALYEELERRDEALQVSLESLAALVLAEIARYEPEEEIGIPIWVTRLRDRLRADYASPPRLEELACDAGRHPVHVARVFRRHMACTIGEYVRRCRLAAAKKLIERTDRPLAIVALDCGYSDQSHLGRAFMARFGVSPARYRRRYSREQSGLSDGVG